MLSIKIFAFLEFFYSTFVIEKLWVKATKLFSKIIENGLKKN